MRKFLALILASTFLTATPLVPVQKVEAATLFEALFPRAAERRRRRVERRRVRRESLFERQRRPQLRALERQRRQIKKKRAKKRVPLERAQVSGAGFKAYFPTTLRAVRFNSLAKGFAVFDRKLLDAEAAREKSVSGPVEDAAFTGGVEQARTVLVSNTTATEEPQESQLPAIRLSAGADLLKTVKVFASTAISKAMLKFYRENPEFMWIGEDGRPTAKAQSVLAVLADADSYGLRVEDYALSVGSTVDTYGTDAETLQSAMQFEFSLTVAALRYLSDARNGVVDPNRISGYHDFSGLNADYVTLAQKLTTSDAPDDLMLDAHPKDKSFAMLKDALTELRKDAIGFEAIPLRRGTFLKPGHRTDQLDNIVEAIRRMASPDMLATHFDAFALDHSEGHYTLETVALVRDFQKSVGLSPDGIIGKNTIARMQGDDPNVRINKVLYAMERLRWHPDQLGNRHVFINQPAYRATYMVGGKPSLSMRAVVGKPSNQTNFFHDKISYVEYNPYWGIPRSILVNEMLPKLRRNASYFDRLGYEVRNTRGKRISSSNVDWYSVGADFPYNVRQPPGRKNALGELKIMFPNKHSIYMHDTPAKSLFKRNQRAFSHGCVRLAEPRKMAAAVLGTNVNAIASRLAGGKNNAQKLKKPIPVYVSYFTAWPSSEGKVKFYGDVYGRDRALGKAMAMEAKARNRGV